MKQERFRLFRILLNGLGMLCVALLTVVCSVPVFAEYPIDVQTYGAQGEYYKAMLSYEKMPKRIATTDSIVSAAKSAWALSLPREATVLYEKALLDEAIPQEERARIEFSRGVIELQESRPQTALLFVERAMKRLESPSPLRGEIAPLWAETLMSIGHIGAAETKYKEALAQVTVSEKGEVSFLLGQCQRMLGKAAEAREQFAQVPLSHERTPDALRNLALLALEMGDYVQTQFWLENGKKRFPQKFLDSWVDYALMTVAADKKDIKKVREIRAKALAQFPPSDAWLTLLEAKAEFVEAQQRLSVGEVHEHAHK